MRNIRLTIAWDGTDFSGWQRQDGGSRGGGEGSAAARTVQGEVERALEKIHKHPVALAGAGRTDAGVHAAGQAANFFCDIASMDAPRFVPALNGLLPRDIRALDAAEVPAHFHARFDAKARTYRYFFIPGRRGLPHETRYALQLWRQPDITLLNAYARLLRGEMDCSFFASPRDASKSRRRCLFGAHFFMERDLLVFEIKANAFLWKMVRSIAGTLLRFEEKNIESGVLRDLIRQGEWKSAGPVLPPQGLFLWKVDYPAIPARENTRSSTNSSAIDASSPSSSAVPRASPV